MLTPQGKKVIFSVGNNPTIVCFPLYQCETRLEKSKSVCYSMAEPMDLAVLIIYLSMMNNKINGWAVLYTLLLHYFTKEQQQKSTAPSNIE